MAKESSKKVFMQIVPVKTIYRRTRTINGLLDNSRQSTLIREVFTEVLTLKNSKKTIYISSVTDVVEKVKVKEVTMRIQDMKKINCTSQH